ncbi:uncharacterized protein LOC134538699 [Bacillus rossius redtenbacheri]|uniref:uncharacterized protein LOC134538699 n=1 Tax=Bacillus rossius redtenbacheri TaxID=93214 RepID=UPI002FDD2E3C
MDASRRRPGTADSSGGFRKGNYSAEEAMSLSLKILHLVGMWPAGKSAAYQLYTVVMCSSYPLFYLMMAWFFLAGGKTTTMYLEQAGVVLAFVPVTFNVVTVLLKRRRLREVVDRLRSFAERTRCAGVLRDAVKQERRVVLLVSVACLLGGSSMLVEPVGTYYTVPDDSNTTAGLSLVLEIYPEGQLGGLAFAAMFAFQGLVFLGLFVTFVPVEVFLSVLVLHAAGQFEALVILVRNSGCLDRRWPSGTGEGHTPGQSQTRRGHPAGSKDDLLQLTSEMPETRPHKKKPASSTGMCSDPAESRDMARVWQNIVACHQEALRNATELCELLRMVLFLYYALTSVVICMILYQFNAAESVFAKVYNCFYLTAVLLRLFIMSFLSTRLSKKSEQISDEVAATEWYEYNNGVKVTLVIMMSRAQRPVQMWAGRFAVMSLETFSAILNAAYSYFNVLNRVT